MKPRIIPLLLLLCGGAYADQIIVQSTDGRTISIEVLSLEGNNVSFKMPGKAQTFTLGLDRFAQNSQDAIKEAAGGIKTATAGDTAGTATAGAYPPLEIDVVIGKRRTKEGYYMVNQTVSGKVKLKNTSGALACPKAEAHIVFIGQDRELNTRLMVLAKESFDFQLARAGTFEHEYDSFTTRYDSDNKGDGNIGGYQYEHYVIILTDEAGNVLSCKSSSNEYQKLVEQDQTLAKKVTKLKKSAFITEKLEAIENQAGDRGFK